MKLHGVTVDYQLNFDSHISVVCKRAAKQIMVLLSRVHGLYFYFFFILCIHCIIY